MLRACVLSYGSKWEDCLPFAKFSYNNSYQASLQMAPFEALYGRKCRTPLNWSKTGENQVFGPDVIKEAKEQVQLIRNRLKAAHLDRRVMPTPIGDLLPSMWETLSTFESHRSWVCNAFMLRVSLHPGTLDRSRFWTVEPPCPTS
jgi:hypothetical protein